SQLAEWDFSNFKTFILLSSSFSASELKGELPRFVEKHIGTEEADSYKFILQPLTDIHLYSSHIKWDFDSLGSITTVYIFLIIAILILSIACFNYMNLTTARSTLRAKEVGIRKVAGAYRVNLIRQFIGESITFTIIAFSIAFFIVELVLPGFNNLVGKHLSANLIKNKQLMGILVSVIVLVGLVSGSYPAFFLSAFQPVHVLKGNLGTQVKGSVLRKYFVMVQFIISIILIIGTMIVYHQLYYLNHKQLGFNKDHLVVIHQNSAAYQAFKARLLQNPYIVDIASASSVPPNEFHFSQVESENEVQKKTIQMKCFFVDDNYFDVLGMELVQGRFFSKDLETDKSDALIINETAAKDMGWLSPLNKKLHVGWRNQTGRIVGVVKDFHFKSLKHKIEPTVFSMDNSNRYCMVAKIKPHNFKETISYIEETWQQFNPDRPFSYHFVDEAFDYLYRSEQRMARIVGYFSILAIFIACLGLFGLASFTIERRVKEIGIRKVFGASVLEIVIQFSKEFMKWVLFANIIAWPVAWYFMNEWLQNFAYRIQVSIWIFLTSAALAFMIALLTVSYQSIKAAVANSVESLRYE
ncbi:MAG: ABC transporter permease, partial [bacterium]